MMRKKNNKRSKRYLSRRVNQSGFSLIEVLIALAIGAMGFLALGSLFMSAMTMNNQSYYVSAAAIKALDISDRLRNNPDGTYVDEDDISFEIDEDPGTECDSGACTANDLAKQDLYEWYEGVKTTFPQGAGRLMRLEDNNTYMVEVKWLNRSNQSESGCDNEIPEDKGKTCVRIRVRP